MKAAWAWLAKILFVIILVGVWYIYEQDKQYEALLSSHTELDSKVVMLEQQLQKLGEENAELEKKSVEGILRETNKVVVSGWEALLEKVEKELNKAKQLMPPQSSSDPSTNDQENKNNQDSSSHQDNINQRKDNEGQPTNEVMVIEGERT